MTYVGRGIDAISNVEKLTNITFDGNTTYNLVKDGVAFTPVGKNNILISINGVIQQGNFTVAGSTIVFDFSPTSNDTCNFIMHYGTGVLNTPADDTVKTSTVQDDAITADKLANSINTAIAANTAKTTNATHSGEVTGATALTIADNIVDEANLKVSNSPTNGYMLTAQSGNTGGLTWAEAGSGEYIKIANNSGTNSVGDVSINDCFSTTYRTYLVTFQFENDRNGNQVWLRWQADDDSTFNSNYRYACHQTNDSGGTSTRVATGDSKWLMCGGTAGGNTAIFGGIFGYMYVHNPYTIASGQAGAGNKYRVGWNAHYNEYSDSGEVVNSNCSGMLEQNDYNVAGLRFLPSANYVAKRNVTVWGLKEY